jgi:hypothetical protein
MFGKTPNKYRTSTEQVLDIYWTTMGGKAEGKRRKGEDKMEGRLRRGREEAKKR